MFEGAFRLGRDEVVGVAANRRGQQGGMGLLCDPGCAYRKANAEFKMVHLLFLPNREMNIHTGLLDGGPLAP